MFFFSYTGKGFAVKDVVEGIEYEFRVSAINNSGAGEFSTPSEFVYARDPKSKWLFRNIYDSHYFIILILHTAYKLQH